MTLFFKFRLFRQFLDIQEVTWRKWTNKAEKSSSKWSVRALPWRSQGVSDVGLPEKLEVDMVDEKLFTACRRRSCPS